MDGSAPYDRPGTWPGSGTGSTPRACSPDHKDAARCIGYLTKYLTKQIGGCHHAETGAAADHAARLAEALRFQPCSPRCANWLRYGIQPKNARPGQAPGCCKGKAHDADHLGYAGRRVLCSRKWSGKTLADHRADRKEWLLPPSVFRQPTPPGTPGNWSRPATRITWTTRGGCCTSSPTVLRWQTALAEARRRAAMPPEEILPATGRAALWRISVMS